MQSIEKVIYLADSFVSYRKYFNENHQNPVMFLHGTNSSGNGSFGGIRTAFNGDRTVIIPDYAGCGNSGLPSEILTVEHLAEQTRLTVKFAGKYL